MVKRGGRAERSRDVQLPLSDELAAALQLRDARDAAERAHIKRLTLQVCGLLCRCLLKVHCMARFLIDMPASPTGARLLHKL